MELETLAKYPFLGRAKEYVSSLNVTLEDMEKHPIYSVCLEMGKKRVLDALGGNIKSRFRDNVEMELTILSYAVAKILVNLTGNKFLVDRYASAEAKQAYRFLRNEERPIVDEIKRDVGFNVAGNKIDFVTYLKFASALARHDPRWKPVNRGVDSGYLRLGDADVLILLREAIRVKIAKPADVRSVPEIFKKTARGIDRSVSKSEGELSVDRIDNKALPPCIRSMIGLLETGDVTHNTLFILATFLIGLGLKTDNIVGIFSRHPNFSEDKTRYQLRFLTGESGKTKYSCPSCSKIKSYGLCRWNCNVKHPLQYYRKQITRPKR